MRQSNEAFMAEVMRRSAVYRARRKKQITGAVLALCLLAVAGFGAFALRMPRVGRLETADNAVSYAPPAADSSEACAAENAADNAPETDGMNDAAEHYEDSSAADAAAFEDEAEASDADSHADSSQAPAEESEGDFTGMTDNQLCDYYGIWGIPDTIYANEHVFQLVTAPEEQYLRGITRKGDETVNDINTWLYREEATGSVLYVSLSKNPDALTDFSADSSEPLSGESVQLDTFSFKAEGCFPGEDSIIAASADVLYRCWSE